MKPHCALWWTLAFYTASISLGQTSQFLICDPGSWDWGRSSEWSQKECWNGLIACEKIAKGYSPTSGRQRKLQIDNTSVKGYCNTYCFYLIFSWSSFTRQGYQSDTNVLLHSRLCSLAAMACGVAISWATVNVLLTSQVRWSIKILVSTPAEPTPQTVGCLRYSCVSHENHRFPTS